MNRASYGWSLTLMLCLAVAGCAGGEGKKSEKVRVHRPPKAPPPVPAQVDTPIDPSLQAQARAELKRGAESSAPLVRAHAIEMMRDAAPEEAPTYVVKGLDDKAAVVRFASALAAGELRVRDARDALHRLALEDKDASIRVAARFGLHRLGDTSLSRELEDSARSPDARTRGDTATVLGLLEEPSALNILRPMRYDSDPAVRLQVAEAMWRLGDESAIKPLVAGTVSLYPDDQMTALMALAAPRDRRIIEHLRGTLTTDYEAVNLVAARAMGMLRSDEGYGIALRGAKSTDPRIRLLAARAMGSIGRSDSQDELTILLRDADPNVRLGAACAILQLK